MTDAITSFRGEYGFLSNFAAAKVVFEGDNYPSVEHAFQAAKALNRDERTTFMLHHGYTRTAAEAKRAGRKLLLRPDWEDVRLDVMLTCLRSKFSQEPFKSKLLATGTRALVEGNTWGDRFWGACVGGAGPLLVGENHLGKLLMRVREELKCP